MKLNPCVTGDTLVFTIDGLKSFKELADSNKDTYVYCLDEKGNVTVSKMLHPRITGYNVELMRITLEDGSKFKTTSNHTFLTREGYVDVDELTEEDEVLTGFQVSKIDSVDIIDEPVIEYRSTKKGTVIKVCEFCGEEFETTWEEREICGCPEHRDEQVYESIKGCWSRIEDNTSDMDGVGVESVEELDERQDVYNGTVALYHNYFTVDEKTGTVVNQLNCGE